MLLFVKQQMPECRTARPGRRETGAPMVDTAGSQAHTIGGGAAPPTREPLPRVEGRGERDDTSTRSRQHHCAQPVPYFRAPCRRVVIRARAPPLESLPMATPPDISAASAPSSASDASATSAVSDASAVSVASGITADAALLVFAMVLVSVVRNEAFQWDVLGRYFTTAAVLDGLLLTLWLTGAVMTLGFLFGTWSTTSCTR